MVMHDRLTSRGTLTPSQSMSPESFNRSSSAKKSNAFILIIFTLYLYAPKATIPPKIRVIMIPATTLPVVLITVLQSSPSNFFPQVHVYLRIYKLMI